MNNNIRILIVEDEAIIAENLRYSLEDLGYAVVDTCYNYKDAVVALDSQFFDLIMLDINLGSRNDYENGLALAETINDTKKTPFIFITAYNDKETITTASKLQPFGYLIKPVNNAMLFATIQMALERFNKNIVAIGPDNEKEKPDYFFVKLGTKTVRISWSDVYCIEAGKNYVKLRSKVNGQDYPIRGSLSYVIDNLLPAKLQPNFFKVNRSIYLNGKYITGYDNNFVYCGSEKFENGKNSLKQLKEAFYG
jgi:two-component system response regulator LytT